VWGEGLREGLSLSVGLYDFRTPSAVI